MQHSLKLNCVIVDSVFPLGPANTPRCCNTVITSGGIISVGLAVSAVTIDLKITIRIAAHLHIRKHPTSSRLPHSHLTGFCALPQYCLLLVTIFVCFDLEYLDAIAHLFPPDTRDTSVRYTCEIRLGWTHLTTPALATLANGTSLPRMSLVAPETGSLGTRRVSDTARKTDVNVAARYAGC